MTRPAGVPRVHEDLSEVLFDEEEIRAAVERIGARISEDYRDRDLVLVGVLKGSLFFLADLSRAISVPHQFDLVGAHSYRGVKPSEQVTVDKDISLDLRGRDVLIVEDIYDSGKTLKVVYDMVRLYQPANVEICALISKNVPREADLPVKYVAFEIEDVFVVGYGLDYRERYRHLKCIGALNPEVYE